MKKTFVLVQMIQIIIASLLCAGTKVSTEYEIPVRFDTTPMGAEIKVDGIDYGITPEVLTLDEGKHDVVISLKGYENRKKVVEIKNDGRAFYHYRFKLEKMVIPEKRIRIDTIPKGAEIKVDGIDYGIAPKVLTLNEGKHSLVISLRGYENFKRVIEIKDAGRDFYRYKFKLEKTIIPEKTIKKNSLSSRKEKDGKEVVKEFDKMLEAARRLERIQVFIAEIIKPSVVSIKSKQFKKNTKSPNSLSGTTNRNTSERGIEQDGKYKPDKLTKAKLSDDNLLQGLGSGIIVDKNGYIVTTNIVVEGADEITVILGDKREFKGEIIGINSDTEIAIIKIDVKNLVAAKFGDSDVLRVGEWSMVVGNHFGLLQTVTIGVIKSVGNTNISIVKHKGMIQTDAAVYPGCTGAPLVNLKGEVIGLINGILAKTNEYEGIGLAIPINIAKDFIKTSIKSVKTREKLTKQFDYRVLEARDIGLKVQSLNKNSMTYLKTGKDYGVIVAKVYPDSPALLCDLQKGDLIEKVNKQIIYDVKGFDDAIKDKKSWQSEEILLLVSRNGYTRYVLLKR